MLTLRSSLRLPQLRSLASSTVKPLTPDDVDLVLYPDDSYLDSFMEYHGKHRNVFKKSDITLWRNSFGDDYKFRMTCLKGTKKMVCCSHSCEFKPIEPSVKPLVFVGMGWVNPEFRKMKGAALMDTSIRMNVVYPDTNVCGHVAPTLFRWWNLFFGIKEEGDAGHKKMDTGYISYYKPSDFFIPQDQDLTFKDITVKSSGAVPEEDMIAYDQKIHPYHRERYIVTHMRDTDGFGKVAYDEDGKVIGMAQAVIYPAGDCNLGPFYGDNPRVVQAMFIEILKDIGASGKKITRFEVRSNASCKDATWINVFLKCKPSREAICSLTYSHWAPEKVDFSKVYCPTHAQLFLV